MLRSPFAKKKSEAPNQSWTLLVFSVGGRRLAVKTTEVAGVSAWNGSLPVPSRTPFVSAVIRDEQGVVPVFDLAELLHVSVQGDNLLCLTAKHPRGAMAICIDEEMPILHTIEAAAVESYQDGDIDAVGKFASGFDQIPILAFARLGSA